VRALAGLLLLVAATASAAERTIQVGGWLGHYDPETVPIWPERLQLLKGGADSEGKLVAEARRRAAAAGNPARFVFYLSFSSLDGGCGCYESDVLGRIRRTHPDLVLRDQKGEPVSTFLDRQARGRQLAMDVGHPAYADAWAEIVLEATARHGWDGVWADNVVRGRFDSSWSATPVNPRSGAPYRPEEYRRDMLAGLRRLRQRLGVACKLLIAYIIAACRCLDY
jgi:hypothetical protein